MVEQDTTCICFLSLVFFRDRQDLFPTARAVCVRRFREAVPDRKCIYAQSSIHETPRMPTKEGRAAYVKHAIDKQPLTMARRSSYGDVARATTS